MTPIIALNWKMQVDPSQRDGLLEVIKQQSALRKSLIILFPDFLSISEVRSSIQWTNIKLGAQDCFYETRGAFTGEISPKDLKEYLDYVLIGHSERRYVLEEDNERIERKFFAAIESGLIPILCVSETQYERNNGKTLDALKNQLSFLAHEKIHQRFYIAYEPYWAIGWTQTAFLHQIKEVNEMIEDIIKELGVERGIFEILYGGSVNGENIKDVMDIAEIYGVVIGTASKSKEGLLGILEKVE